jgi:hypothetical protein
MAGGSADRSSKEQSEQSPPGAALRIKISAGRQASATAETSRAIERTTVDLLSITNMGFYTQAPRRQAQVGVALA